MREIRFRAWHKGAYDSLGRQVFAPQMIYDKWNGECCRFVEEGQPVELMQYTGLHDKAGKEIYEGDILLADNDYVDEDNLYLEVKWDDSHTGYYLRDDKHDIDGDMDDEFEVIDKCYQVVGNIYENPELLSK